MYNQSVPMMFENFILVTKPQLGNPLKRNAYQSRGFDTRYGNPSPNFSQWERNERVETNSIIKISSLLLLEEVLGMRGNSPFQTQEHWKEKKNQSELTMLENLKKILSCFVMSAGSIRSPFQLIPQCR